MKITQSTILLGTFILGMAGTVFTTSGADPLDPALQAKIDAKVKETQTWAAQAVIINAVRRTTQPFQLSRLR
jgi:hypothetical protein